MINYISSWAEQVIIAVIIATILEMILPKGNSKKYIKTMIGIYILYTVISPAITLATGKNLTIDYSEYEKYFNNTKEYQALEKDFENITEKSIQIAYKEEIKKQIQKDIEEMGLYLENIDLETNLENGEIIKVSLIIIHKETEDKANNNIQINKIEIGEKKKETKTNNLSKDETEKIKKLMQENYGVSNENIKINSM